MGLAVEHRLQAVLNAPEESIGIDHDPSFLGRQAADVFELRERATEGVGVADFGVLAAMEKLQELDDELDVADPAMAGLDLDPERSRRRRSAARSAASSP